MIDISNRKFKGEFFDDPKHVQEDLANIRREIERGDKHPVTLECLKNTEEREKKYEFDFVITSFNPQTGLFTATTKDHFGEGIAAGELTGDFIKFLKIYGRAAVKESLPPTRYIISEYSGSRFFEYIGRMSDHHGDSIEAYGEYKNMHGNERTSGIWEMESI